MKYSKQPISIADQIAQLKSRGLIIGDEADAEKVLSIISYVSSDILHDSKRVTKFSGSFANHQTISDTDTQWTICFKSCFWTESISKMIHIRQLVVIT